MLKRLSIHNIILISHAEVEFSKGLHILTGETGSGKSSFIQAFDLALGGKGDDQIIKTQETTGFVEATFDIREIKEIHALLDECGISIGKDEDLVIRRQFTKGARSRTVINCQTVPLTTLQQFAKHLVESVGYKAHFDLKLPDKQRDFVDLYTNTFDLKLAMKETFDSWQEAKTNLSHIQKDILNKEKELAFLEKRLLTITAIDPKPNEEEELDIEYTRLSQATLIEESLQTLYETTENLLNEQRRLKRPLEKLTELLPELTPLRNHLESATVELEEIDYSLRESIGSITPDPARLEYIEDRLSSIRALLKEYNNDPSELQNEKERLERRIEHFQNLDLLQHDLQKAHDQAHNAALEIAKQLSSQRKKGAKNFQTDITKELQSLNIPDAKFQIAIEDTPLSENGSDKITFLFSANEGSTLEPVQQVASGGELSRLLLIIKILLANKESIPLLIFDEIDANIGGETASLVGERLKQIAAKRQVFAITHFPQVANHADHHFCVFKERLKDSVNCQIKPLNNSEKKEELIRMLGGKMNPLTFSSQLGCNS